MCSMAFFKENFTGGKNPFQVNIWRVHVFIGNHDIWNKEGHKFKKPLVLVTISLKSYSNLDILNCKQSSIMNLLSFIAVKFTRATCNSCKTSTIGLTKEFCLYLVSLDSTVEPYRVWGLRLTSRIAVRPYPLERWRSPVYKVNSCS